MVAADHWEIGMAKRKLILLALVGGIFASPALADETGKSALDAWISSNADIGLDMSYQSAEESGDMLAVRGFKASFSTTFASGSSSSTSNDTEASKSQPGTLHLTWITPLLEAENFQSSEAGFLVDHLVLSDDTQINVHIVSPDQNRVVIDGTIEGYELINAAWPHYPNIPKDPDHPVSRWLPLLDLALDYRLEEHRIDRFTLNVRESGETSDPTVVHYEQRDLVLEDLRNGIIGKYSTGPSTQRVSGNDGGDDVTVRIASTRMVDYDLGALMTLLNPAPDANSDYTQAISSMVMLGYNIDAGPLDVNIDRIAYEDIRVRPPGSDLLSVLDASVSGAEIDPAQFGIAVFDAYRSMAIGRFSVDGVTAIFPDPENQGTTGSIKLAQLLISNLDSDGLDEFSLSSLAANLESSGAFNLGKMSIGDVEFAPYGPMKEFVSTSATMESEPDPFEIAKIFSPLSISTAMKDFYAQVHGEGEIRLGSYFLGLKSVVPPVPTDIELTIDGIEVPIASLDDEEAEALFAAAGIDTLRMSESIRLHWDEQSEDLIIDNLVVELGDVGKISARARLGGVPRAILQNPERIEAVIATLNLKSFELELINEGGVEMALGLAATQQGVGETQMTDFLLGQLDAALRTIGNDRFASEVSREAERFFADPGTLRVSARPENPVPVVQIIANMEFAPGSIPDILDLQIDANP